MRKRDYIGMNVYWFGLAFLWNGLHPIILPAMLLGFVPEALKNTYLGSLTFGGLILAMVIQPLAGALSDRTRSRWGRRRPWILLGVILTLIVLAIMARASSLGVLILAYVLLQLVSNTAHGPAQGLIPDLVPQERHGLAAGIKNLFEMSGLIVTSLVAGKLMSDGNAALALTVTGVVVAAAAGVTLVGTPEAPASGVGGPAAVQALRETLRVDLSRAPGYARLLVSRFLILLGIYAVQAFAQYYIRDRLQVPDPAAVTGNLMATIGLALTALVFPAGYLSDRFGRLRLNQLAGILAALGVLMLIPIRTVPPLYIAGTIIGAATGIFLSVNWALATDMIPQDEAGKYLGLSNLATAGAGAASRLGGPLIDGLNALRPGAFLGYPALMLLAALSIAVGTWLANRLSRIAYR